MKMQAQPEKRRSAGARAAGPAICTCCVISLWAGSIQAQQDPARDVTVRELLRMWREREEAVQTFRAEYREIRTLLKGMSAGRDLRGLDDDGNPFPPEDTTTEIHLVMHVDGTKWRMDMRGPWWNHRAEAVVEQQFVELFDGQDYLTYFGISEATNDAYPLVFVNPGGEVKFSKESFGQSSTSFVLLLNFRNSLDRFLGVNADEWRMGTLRAVIDGNECFVVEDVKAIPGIGEAFHRCWVDPQRGYRVLRREIGFGDFVGSRVDIRYREDPEFGWIPESWELVTHAQTDAGETKVEESSEFIVDNIEFNVLIDPDVFRFQYTEGDRVVDYTEGEERREYLVRSDGSRRAITQGELARGATYEQIRSTESGLAAAPERGRSVYSYLFIIGIACAAALAFWIVRRSR